jgi:hypothetical protein
MYTHSSVCICAVAGGLTPASLATISTQVTANQGILAPVISALGGITQTATRVAANTLPLVGLLDWSRLDLSFICLTLGSRCCPTLCISCQLGPKFMRQLRLW